MKTGATKVTGWKGTINEKQPADGYPTKYVANSVSIYPFITSFSKSRKYRPFAQLDAENDEKDVALLEKLYGPNGSANHSPISGIHFTWQAKDIIDRLVRIHDGMLDPVERQLINYLTLMCRGLLMHSLYSMQDALDGPWTMGLSAKEITQLTECGELVARWAGRDMKYWPELKIVKAIAGREVVLLSRVPHTA